MSEIEELSLYFLKEYIILLQEKRVNQETYSPDNLYG